MGLTRRSFLETAGAAGAAVTLLGCDGVYREISKSLGAKTPEHVVPPQGAAVDAAHHLLNRAAFGPWPGDVERVRAMGSAAWLDEQLAPELIDDTACSILWRRLETLDWSAGNIYEFEKPEVREELVRATMLRAVYSKRQLFETVVEFWSDHFNIFTGKSDCAWLKTVDDREVIRKHAFGNFRELLRASALSPAMLVYLDGKANKKAKPEDMPNENYARELMELHTLGVHGGYTQRDIMEVARCLTGWHLREKWKRGTVEFHPYEHDDGAKEVLGTPIPAHLGEGDLDRVLDIVSTHPSTAQFIATKLCRRFVNDIPPETLVARVAETFQNTKGEIKPVLKTLFLSTEFTQSPGKKLKRPFRFLASALRSLGADTNAARPLLKYLLRLGQAPFGYPTPDGYPDETTPWLGTLLWRWNFALALASNRIEGTKVDLDELSQAIGGETRTDWTLPLQRHLLGRDPSTEERAITERMLNTATGSEDERRAQLVALLVASPAFQLS